MPKQDRSIFSKIDWDVVSREIRDGLPEPSCADDLFFVVRETVERFLPGDARNFTLEGVELNSITQLQGVPVKATADLVFRVRENAEEPYRNFAGQRLVVDWKTTRNLDYIWAARHKRSWQCRLYSAIFNARLFEYRGIQLHTPLPKFRPLLLDIGEDHSRLYSFLAGIQTLRDSMLSLPVWPQVFSDVCNSCDFQKRCESGQEPKGQVSPDTPLSYSRISQFLKCPESYRQEYVLPEPEGRLSMSQPIYIGQAVHRGLAAAYAMAFDLEIPARVEKAAEKPLDKSEIIA